MPLAPDDKAVFREQAPALAELASLSSQQEAILREIAVRREPADMAFPPVRKIQDLEKVAARRPCRAGVFRHQPQALRLLDEQREILGLGSRVVAALTKQIMAMLRDMGLFAAVGEVSAEGYFRARSGSNRPPKCWRLLTKNSPADFSKPFEELVIVPDGVMWYLPFEALQVTVEGKLQPLISRFRIRYAPTISLADRRPIRRRGRRRAMRPSSGENRLPARRKRS